MNKIKTRAELFLEAARVSKMIEGKRIELSSCVKLDGALCHGIIPSFVNEPELYEFALAIVEDKPCYVGDVLYSDRGEKAIIKEDGLAYFENGSTNNLDILSWNKPKPELWEPEGGEWFISLSGYVDAGETVNETRLYGIERKTEAQAEAATQRMRTFNRLDAWIDENVGYEFGFKVEFDGNSVAVVHYIPAYKVLELEKLVNDGVVIL